MLPISSTYISSIHSTGFCLVDCCKVLQQQGSVKVDQKLENLLMQVFYTLKELIEQLREPSGFKDDRAEQVMSQVELTRKALMAHLNWLVQQAHSTNSLEVAIAPNEDEVYSLEDLESLIDNLSLDRNSVNSTPTEEQDR